jgi:hypothetical protein
LTEPSEHSTAGETAGPSESADVLGRRRKRREGKRRQEKEYAGTKKAAAAE